MVIAETGTKPAHGEAPATTGTASRLVAAAPYLLPLVVASVGVVGTLLLLLEQFRVPLVLLLGGLLAAVLVRAVGLAEAAPLRRDRLWDGLAVLVALAFAAVNARYAAQNIVVGRDPGVYTVAGQWLAHHHSILIPTQDAVFQPGPVTAASAGIGGTGPGELYAQGAHLLPQMLGITSAVLGESAMFRINVLFGGLGLLAVYGFGRLVVSRGWALLAVVLLGGSLPQIAFARDDYTEPLSQLFIFGGLALLWRARRGQPVRWAAAGMVLGAGCMARIDAFLVLPSLIAFAGLVAAIAPRGRERRLAATDALAALAGAAVPAVLGLLDLKRLSSGYYRDLSGQFHQIQTLVLLSAVAAAVLVAVAWTTPLVARLQARPGWRRPVGAAAAGVVVLVGLALAARPLLGPVHTTTSNAAVQAFIKASQLAEGTKVDATRTYAEQSVTWLVWYLGPLAVVLGLVGTAWLVLLAVRKERLDLVPFLV
ncbi:MAG: ArnT family glycosyltransferase, partial [Nocardioidaceae bacterium]